MRGCVETLDVLGWTKSILHIGSRLQNGISTRIHSNTTGKSDQKHHEKDWAFPILCYNTSWRNRRLPLQWHDSRSSRLRLLTLWNKFQKLSGGGFLHVQWLPRSTKKWSHPHYSANNQNSHVLSSRIQTGSPINKLQRSHPSTPFNQRNGTQSTPHTNVNLQHNGDRRSQK